MHSLSQLKNTTRPKKKIQRVGRGVGSKRGKTSCRGGKGDSARQGYKKRFGYEGGQVPLYRKLPIRGFTRGRFVKPSKGIPLSLLEAYYQDGETVNIETLREKGLVPRRLPGGIKILSNGDLTKKLNIEANSFSAAAVEKLEAKGISYKVLA
ncbi:MAG: 50S ribosomal protein L15 [Chlamydiae bacterium RIFCSPHIGHO2_12_FULL_49_9]|nr:MAG: 50S ribosomal protein L15 [Chlamydiae bacterium RIFCSPHIGHO2_12_FULL_49_9]